MQTRPSNRQNKLTLYNKDYLEKAGYDPASETLTWGSFREACKKVTKQGKGQYYGFIMGGKQGGAYSGFVSTLAQMAGAIGGEWNWKTGEYNFDTEQYISAIELMLALKSDGSIFPGVISMNNPQARARIANGVAGIILQGPWNIPQWERENPDFNFGVASVPLRDPDKFVPLAQAPGNGGKWYVYGKSDNTAVIGDVFSYLGSLQGQIAWAKIDTVADPAAFPKALDKVIESGAVDKKKQFALKMDQQQTRIAPSPVIRNSDIGEVNLAYKTPDPEFWQVVQGLFTGQLSDIKKQMKDTKDRYTKAREDAIKTAKSRGAKVSMDDYVFPNWDPQKDYVPEDYKALK